MTPKYIRYLNRFYFGFWKRPIWVSSQRYQTIFPFFFNLICQNLLESFWLQKIGIYCKFMTTFTTKYCLEIFAIYTFLRCLFVNTVRSPEIKLFVSKLLFTKSVRICTCVHIFLIFSILSIYYMLIFEVSEKSRKSTKVLFRGDMSSKLGWNVS